MSGYVYFIQGENQLLKIGYTENPAQALVEALKNIVDQRVLTPSARSNARAALKLAEGE